MEFGLVQGTVAYVELRLISLKPWITQKANIQNTYSYDHTSIGFSFQIQQLESEDKARFSIKTVINVVQILNLYPYLIVI